MEQQPSRRARYLFWLIAGCMSVTFAEIASASYMFPFNTPWGLLVVLPLYGLHTLVLAWIVYRYGKARLYTLFLAGAIFGLYEAYITKVLWSPPWGNAAWFVGGVGVVEAVVLVLLWHPIMSFIVPLFISESAATRSREVLSGLPGPLRSLFSTPKGTYAAIVGLALFCGVNQGAQSPSPLHSLASVLSAGVVLGALIFVGRRAGLDRYEIRQLLPTEKEFMVLLGLLFLMYAVSGAFLRPEALPGLASQATIGLLYAGFFTLLYLSLRKSIRLRLPAADFPIRFSWKSFAAFFLAFGSTSALVSLLFFRLAFAVTLWLGAILVGPALLALAARDALKNPAIADRAL